MIIRLRRLHLTYSIFFSVVWFSRLQHAQFHFCLLIDYYICILCSGSFLCYLTFLFFIVFFVFRFLRQYVAHQFFLRLLCLFIRLFFCFRYQFKSFKDDRFRLLVKVKFVHRLFLKLGRSILRASPSIVFEWSPLLAFNALYFLFLYSVSDDWCPFRSLENHVMLPKILRTPFPTHLRWKLITGSQRLAWLLVPGFSLSFQFKMARLGVIRCRTPSSLVEC